MYETTVRTLWIVALSMLPLGCGSQDPSAEDSTSGDVTTRTESLLPFAEGNTWTYRVTKDGETSLKVTTIGEVEPVGGSGPNKELSAHRVTTTKKDGADETLSWQALVDGKVVRYREQSFSASTGELELEEHWDPYKLHVDDSTEHTTAGASWLDSYEETKLPVGETPTTSSVRDRWSVSDTHATVTVPAGTFDDAIVLVKSGASNQKTYYYVPGIGKVKEVGSQTEELVSYEVAP